MDQQTVQAINALKPFLQGLKEQQFKTNQLLERIASSLEEIRHELGARQEIRRDD